MAMFSTNVDADNDSSVYTPTGKAGASWIRPGNSFKMLGEGAPAGRWVLRKAVHVIGGKPASEA